MAEPLLELEGIWTHLPVADGEAADRAYTEGQLDLFDRLVAELAAAGITAPLLHAANTAGAIAFPGRATTWCAAGSASTATSPAVGPGRLRRAGGGRAAAPGHGAQGPGGGGARRSRRGSAPRTGGCRPLPARSLVATVPIGYADGVPRALFDGGYEVLIGGVRRPLAGAVTMDQIVVDCGDDDSVRPGDEVVLLGRQGDEEITADDWAAMAGDDQLRGGVRRRPAHAAHCAQPPRCPRA